MVVRRRERRYSPEPVSMLEPPRRGLGGRTSSALVRVRSSAGRRGRHLTSLHGRLSSLGARTRRFAPPGWPSRSWRRESTTVTESMARRRHRCSPTSLARGARRPAARSRAGLRFRRISAPPCPRIDHPGMYAEIDIRLARRPVSVFLEVAGRSRTISHR